MNNEQHTNYWQWLAGHAWNRVLTKVLAMNFVYIRNILCWVNSRTDNFNTSPNICQLNIQHKIEIFVSGSRISRYKPIDDLTISMILLWVLLLLLLTFCVGNVSLYFFYSWIYCRRIGDNLHFHAYHGSPIMEAKMLNMPEGKNAKLMNAIRWPCTKKTLSPKWKNITFGNVFFFHVWSLNYLKPNRNCHFWQTYAAIINIAPVGASFLLSKLEAILMKRVLFFPY